VEEDANALRRIQAIRESPSYRLAEQDIDFIRRDDIRGPRLQLEYLKPEIMLSEEGIDHTIAQAAGPSGVELARRVVVAERILAKSQYYDVAREFGRLVGDAGWHASKPRVVVMTGGGPGIMEAANRGAFDAGAKSVGLNIDLPHEQYPNPYISPELCFRFHYFALRKLHLLLRAKALIAFPGGYGTIDELFEILTLIQTRKIKPIPVVLVGESYWRRAVDIDFLADEGVIDQEDRELFWFAETAQEIWSGIVDWYAACGEPLCATT
jgi:uncharacterized protein (TIGR00730 family)